MKRAFRLGAIVTGTLMASLAGIGAAPAQKTEKLKLEDVVAQHVASLGPTANTSGAKPQKLEGTAEFRIVMGGTGNLTGSASFVTEGRSFHLRVEFEDPTYHGERVRFDGEKVEVGTLRPGARTPLGDFLFTNNEIVKEGLFGGTLSAAWPLADLAGRQPKLKYDGVKTVNGQKVHVLRYRAKKQSGDLDITLYFEAETFRHVGTIYRASYGVPIAGTPAEAVKQETSDYALEESFSDFKAIRGGSLPTRWKIVYSRKTISRGSSIWQWDLTFDRADVSAGGEAKKPAQ